MIETAKAGRISLIDAVRGLAIIGVAVFHLVWDLRWLGFTQYDAFWDPFWLGLAKVLVSTFLSLVGVSLVLAHPDGIRWRAFWIRFGVIAGAALLVSIGTYIAFQDGFVYFGVLHAIALFSLGGLLFLRLPVWLTALAAALFLFAHFFFQSADFNVRWLSWIGFWTLPPYTQDLVPVFPGFGFTLAGIAATRLMLDLGWRETLSRIDFSGVWYRALLWCGRWSLIIYLVHQPVLFGGLYGLAYLVQPQAEQRAEAFVGSCAINCEESGGEGAYCTQYCACALDLVETSNLWDDINAVDPTEEQLESSRAVSRLCEAMTTPAQPPPVQPPPFD